MGDTNGNFYYAIGATGAPVKVGAVYYDVFVSSITPTSDPKTIFATTTNIGSPHLWISQNGGVTWSQFSTGLLAFQGVIH
jgi:hypothetical protein